MSGLRAASSAAALSERLLPPCSSHIDNLARHQAQVPRAASFESEVAKFRKWLGARGAHWQDQGRYLLAVRLGVPRTTSPAVIGI